jgi:autotransporter-associated beta strand protein
MLALSGTNTYVGNVNISAGTVSISSAGNLGSLGNDVVISGGGSIAHGAAGHTKIDDDAVQKNPGPLGRAGYTIRSADRVLALAGTVIAAGTRGVRHRGDGDQRRQSNRLEHGQNTDTDDRSRKPSRRTAVVRLSTDG